MPSDAITTQGQNDAIQPIEPEWALTLTDAELVQARADTVAYIEDYEAKIQPVRDRKALIEAVLLARLQKRGATVLAHPDYTVEVVCKDSTTVLESELQPLFALADEGVIEKRDLDKALWWVTPDPVLKHHLTYLKGLGKKYGEPVLNILAKAVRKNAGTPTLKIEVKQREPKRIEASK